MSAQQQQPQLPDMNAVIQATVQQSIGQMVPGIVAATMNDIGHALRSQAASMTSGMSAEEILTAPRKLASGHAIVLTRRMRYNSPNMILVVNPVKVGEGEEAHIHYSFTAIHPNELDMTQSKLVQFQAAEQEELVRQVKALGLEVPMAFALHVFGPEVQGLPYFETDEDKQAREFAEAEAAAAQAGKLAAGDAAAANETAAANGAAAAPAPAAAPAAAPADGDDDVALVPSKLN